MARCMRCMSEVSDRFKVCPNCNTLLGVKSMKEYHLPSNTILDNRYIIGLVSSENGIVIKYNGYDNLKNKRVFVYEYYPVSLVQRKDNMVAFKNSAMSEIFADALNGYLKEVELLKANNTINGIQTVTDCLIENNTCYVICEFERYVTLNRYLKERGNLSPRTALSVIYSILYTLQSLNKFGIIHGNISPEHIIITENEEIKLIDFGSGSYIKSTPLTIYNPNFSAPELKENNEGITAAADVYSVGAVYYKMLTGITPYSFVQRQSGKEIISIRKLGIRINPHIENAILNAINIDKDTRYSNANEFFYALKRKSEARIEDGFKSAKYGEKGHGSHLKIVLAIVGVILAIAIIIGVLSYNACSLISKNNFSFDNLLDETTTLVETTVETTEISTETTVTTTVTESESTTKKIDNNEETTKNAEISTKAVVSKNTGKKNNESAKSSQENNTSNIQEVTVPESISEASGSNSITEQKEENVHISGAAEDKNNEPNNETYKDNLDDSNIENTD
ncbi:MAG: protein kinase [Lachnospirales bacterium]